jgi:hypothetical protein
MLEYYKYEAIFQKKVNAFLILHAQLLNQEKKKYLF